MFALDHQESQNHFDIPAKVTKKKRIQKQAKSEITKNVCFNLCQKTITIIKNQEYHAKVEQLCLEFGENVDSFITSIVKMKKEFTGTKALDMFITSKTKISRIFGKFMKWFLQEKYLRHAIKEG
eukprot:GHVR01034402.1.p1 GENE.GHVR01034402.1~~GHVR01034402.1.p1  ORF type:complete len:124 (+),score=9.63 GHVR01034402.1:194-565(+)